MFGTGFMSGLGTGMKDTANYRLKERMLAQQRYNPATDLAGVGSPSLGDMMQQQIDPMAPMPDYYGEPMAGQQPLIDPQVPEMSFKDHMLSAIMQDNPRDKYSKKKDGGGGGLMNMIGPLLQMFGGSSGGGGAA